jgi:hypothetical protein
VAALEYVAVKQLPHPTPLHRQKLPQFYPNPAGKAGYNLTPPQQKPCLGRPLQTACWAGTNFADPKITADTAAKKQSRRSPQ